MSALRTGIVGTGKIAVNHAMALQAIPGVDLVGVSDVEPDRAAAFAARFGIAGHDPDPESFLSSGLDAITVCTPHPSHERVVVAAARHGLHVLCEKPIAVTLAEADRMVTAMEEAGVRFGVLFQRRFWPSAARLRAAIDEGRLGPPIVGTVTMRWGRDAEYYAEPWRGRWDTEGGGALLNQGIHYVDLLQWYLGTPVRVYGAIRTLKHGDCIEVEDTAVATVEFASGAVATIQAGTTFAPGLGTTVFVSDAAGQAATVTEYPEGTGHTDLWTVKGEEAYRQLLSTGIDADPPLSRIHEGLMPFHREQITEFVTAVREGRDPLVTGRDARTALAVVVAIYESSRTGLPVDLT
ncbi:Gfo/Idh/MocA family protein [Streptomyces rhizosphaericus]|uniref:Gfo/Idh/MocA family oxidoreductase n=1 Tax=Streptomyces rhizosphaericus TaxID=114699 RepID=A0A6G4AMG9_9ACTN|nr:Gfo/Idh/MocA family oxidoreductase [Streptomyces rhizosphaericus]NEW73687.1 Gfo/Idh/MocA family oxidoreductase [Streptomyces rhizosphaericus]